MIQVAKCPSCGAPLEIDDDRIESCDFCGSRVVVSSQNVTTSASFGFDALLLQARKLKEILYLARSGNKILAIKIYRETFNTGLAEAKEAVENLEAGKPINALYMRSFNVHDPLQNNENPYLAEIRTELMKGHKINAIKIYRETFDVSLAEAKESVEKMASLEFGRQSLNINKRAVVKTTKTVGALTIIAILLAILAGIIGIGFAFYQ